MRKLAESLRARGVTVWLDEAEMRVGDSLIGRIGDAIDSMDFFAVVLSSESLESEWVKRELNSAMQREFKERRVVVLPLLRERAALPPFLRDKLYADFTDDARFVESLNKVLDAVELPSGDNETNRRAVPESIGEALQQLESRLLSFTDIQITDIDEELSEVPTQQPQLVWIYLKLSEVPTESWVQSFEEVWSQQWYSMLREAHAVGGHIAIHCIPDELSRYHMPQLLQALGFTNTKYRQSLEHEIAVERQNRRRKEAHLDSLRDLKRQLGLGGD